ncbi:hypothetical protein, partial [Photobacterium leiognathi]|uniref:hypothetical protein n=1 Tax=Photobacterium leiognathi TaxID=553611 RepID=UPI002980D1D4
IRVLGVRISPPLPSSKASSEMTRLFCICISVITADFAVFSAIACWELDRQPGRITSPQLPSKATSEMTRIFAFLFKKKNRVLIHLSSCIVIFLLCYGDEKAKGI